MIESIQTVPSDTEYSARAKDILWSKVGGDDKVAELLCAIRHAGGSLHIHGGAARALVCGDENFGDIDFVVSGVNGDVLEPLVRSVMGKEWDVGARRHHEEDSPIKTIEMAKDGRLRAEAVCARKDDKPNVEAMIEDHLKGCFTPDGKLIAFEISYDEVLGLQLRKIEKEKEIILDAETVRADHVWLWYHSLVTGKVPKEMELGVQKMICKFMETRGEQLVMWRRPDESLDEWMRRRNEVQSVEPSRVKEVEIRSFGRCNVEFIVDKLNSALESNPKKFWEVGMGTGLLPAVFPVLKHLDKMPDEVRSEILENLQQTPFAKEYYNWLNLFKPIIREMHRPIRQGKPAYGLGYEYYSWTRQANPFIGIERIAGVGEEPCINNTELENRVLEVNWRNEVMQYFTRFHGGRFLRILRKHKYKPFREKCNKLKEFPMESMVRISREIALMCKKDPHLVYQTLTSYLPLGEEKIRGKIRSIALDRDSR